MLRADFVGYLVEYFGSKSGVTTRESLNKLDAACDSVRG